MLFRVVECVQSLGRALVVACLLSSSSCADDYATGEDVLAACNAYQEEACRVFAGCLGLGPADIASCQQTGRARCQQGLGETTCWDRQVSALEDCAGYLADATCDALCDGDSCVHECEWTCPAAAPEGTDGS